MFRYDHRHAILAPLLAVACVCAASEASAAPAADLVLRNGRIYTVEDARPIAQAVAIRDGRIVAVGSDSEIGKLVGPGTRSIE
ncbi:MAG TPA: hypothetical protein VJ011_07640, partial [Steroidobacteraceae bacterium]|nr:hypothetical protein [Steroidobacteraceae bacterium]